VTNRTEQKQEKIYNCCCNKDTVRRGEKELKVSQEQSIKDPAGTYSMFSLEKFTKIFHEIN